MAPSALTCPAIRAYSNTRLTARVGGLCCPTPCDGSAFSIAKKGSAGLPNAALRSTEVLLRVGSEFD